MQNNFDLELKQIQLQNEKLFRELSTITKLLENSSEKVSFEKEFYTIEDCAELKGGAALNTYKCNRFLLPGCGNPICSTRFKEFDFTCPTCGVSTKEIEDQTQANFIIKKKVYEMNDSDKQKYKIAYEERMNQIKQKTGRLFLTEEERVQFWKEYGLLD